MDGEVTPVPEGASWFGFPDGGDQYTRGMLDRQVEEASLGSLKFTIVVFKQDTTQQAVFDLDGRDYLFGHADPVISGLRAFPADQVGSSKQAAGVAAYKAAARAAKVGLPLRALMPQEVEDILMRTAAKAGAATAAGAGDRRRDRSHLGGATSPEKPKAQVPRKNALERHESQVFRVRGGVLRCADVVRAGRLGGWRNMHHKS